MQDMYTALWVMLVFLLIIFLKTIVFGSSLWDRLLGMSLISSKIIVIIIFFASLNNTTFLLDYAIIYALFGFIGVIFIALFISKRERKEKRGKE